jgi:hypothetical protein
LAVLSALLDRVELGRSREVDVIPGVDDERRPLG